MIVLLINIVLRYQSERSVQPVHNDEIRRIAEASSVPIIAKYVHTCSNYKTFDW